MYIYFNFFILCKTTFGTKYVDNYFLQIVNKVITVFGI